jgi:hypothetical protein
MPSAQSNRWISFPGLSFNDQAVATSGDGQFLWQVDIPANPAANAGVMTSTVATLGATHTIVTSGALVDVYWAAGRRLGCTVAKAGADVTCTDGAGDSLPTGATPVILCTQTSIATLPLDGDLVTWFAVVYRNALDTGALGSIDLWAAAATVAHFHLVHETASGGCNNVVNIGGGDTNSLTGDPITHGFASHDSTSAGILYIMALVNTTP